MTDNSDKRHILDKVLQRKQRAINLNLLKIAEDLYPELKSLHLVVKHENSHWKEIITEARCVNDDLRFKKIIFKMTNGNEYTVVYQEHDSLTNFEMRDDSLVAGGYEFLLYVGDQKVLGVLFQSESDNELPFSFYRALDISAFREGNWIQDFQALHRIERGYSNALSRKIVDKHLKKLKEDFDIE